MWNCRDQDLMSYHKRVLWASGEKILCVHDQQRSHRSFLINTSNTKQRIHHNNPFCQHLEIISAKAPQKKIATFNSSLSLTATDVNEWASMTRNHWNGWASEGTNHPTTNKQTSHCSILKKKIQGYLHPSSHSSQKILWKLYQSLFSKWT